MHSGRHFRFSPLGVLLWNRSASATASSAGSAFRAAATPGPWDWEYGVSQRTAWGVVDRGNRYVLRFAGPQEIGIVPDPEPDMDVLLAARNALPALLAVAEAATALLWVFACRCDVDYTARGRHEPNTQCGEDVGLRAALAALEALT